MNMSPDYNNMLDEALVLLLQEGNTEIFGILMERYEAKLLRYGHKFLSDNADIEDIVQDVFLSVYRNSKGFDTTQRFSPWIYRIAHNAFVNALRKKSYSPFVPFDFDTLVSHVVYDDPSIKERESKEMMMHIEKGLNLLSPKYKEIMVLYYIEDLGYKDIADILQVPVGTVGIRLKRAKVALQKEVQKKYGTD